ncbi:mannan endo-1,4-beta-mannosidase 2-like [Zingiber officinale]|nr:mannan endo-1,4-beta-mannosidase 2-like [Zingiber officinale]
MDAPNSLKKDMVMIMRSLSLQVKQPGKKMARPGNGIVFPVLAFALLILVMYLTFGAIEFWPGHAQHKARFVERNGSQFTEEGRAFYVNGWNSYWLMDQAVEESGRERVTEVFRAAATMGLTVCRTWAFNDGAYHALQTSLGVFDEKVFRALDWVIVEAQRHGVRLLLSLVNNLENYGGKTQYVKWAWEEGLGSSSYDDSFFSDPSVRSYFKTYLKTILTRKNHLTGIEYRDDPTIFAWELMNEPQCRSDVSGDVLQAWIEEMAEHVKAIDEKHLLTVGLEGFYGSANSPEKEDINPGKWYGKLGSDFLRNSRTPSIDFASVHIYPDHWLSQANLSEKMSYTSKWVASHIEDGKRELNKPILFAEFGLSNKVEGFEDSHRIMFYRSIFDAIYDSATKDGAGAGALVWQFLVGGMGKYNDEFGIVPGEFPAIDELMKEQSCRLLALRQGKDSAERTSADC